MTDKELEEWEEEAKEANKDIKYIIRLLILILSFIGIMYLIMLTR